LICCIVSRIASDRFILFLSARLENQIEMFEMIDMIGMGVNQKKTGIRVQLKHRHNEVAAPLGTKSQLYASREAVAE
jgi:hypothetical protein